MQIGEDKKVRNSSLKTVGYPNVRLRGKKDASNTTAVISLLDNGVDAMKEGGK